MKKNFLRKIIFILLFFFSLYAAAQEGLLIRNTKNGRAWMYEKGARVTYIRFHEEEYTTGRLNGLLDSAVVFGNDTVKLSSIAGIRKRNPVHKIARAAGMPLMLIGTLFMGDGIAQIYSHKDTEGGTTTLLIGVAVFAVGFLPYELNLADLTVGFGGEWKIEICRECLAGQ